MTETIIISDLHLGSVMCQSVELIEFLSTFTADRLILNGDTFESHDFRRLSKEHLEIFRMLRELATHKEVIWVSGNHDGPHKLLSRLIGVRVRKEYTFMCGDKKVLVLHGHQFDDFIDRHPFVTWISDIIYQWLQKLDRKHYYARLAKHRSKTFLRSAQCIERGAIAYADTLGCDYVCAGHTHHPIAKERYFNSGSWAEQPCTFIRCLNGVLTVEEYSLDAVSV